MGVGLFSSPAAFYFLGMAEVAPAAVSQARVAVSNTKKPLFFYVNLAKKLLAANGSVELSALGLGACRPARGGGFGEEAAGFFR